MSNVLEFRKAAIKASPEYRLAIGRMDKLDLLEEMVRYQEARTTAGHLTDEMVGQGLVLFEALSKTAETQELQILTKTYLKHLECEALERRKKA
jgi:hypothetical protein